MAVTFGGELHPATMRYGENPHQWAAFYTTPESDARPGVATARQHQGKELSYNNLNDTDAAFELVAELVTEVDASKAAAVAIIKHANPCGVAIGRRHAEGGLSGRALALRSGRARSAASSRSTARSTRRWREEMVKIFTEVVIAPEADRRCGKAIFATKKNLRLSDHRRAARSPRAGRGLIVRSLAGGLLVQSRDNGIGSTDLRISRW